MHAYDMRESMEQGSSEPLMATGLPGLSLVRRGKEKDVYDLGDMLLMVSTDRLSADGITLRQGIAGKGRITCQLSSFWFRKLRGIFPNHVVTDDVGCFPAQLEEHADVLEGRTMLVWKTTPLPIRCVVRGYLAGDGWKEYRKTGEICGMKIREGLVESQRLPAPVFTPTVKGRPGGMNENIEFCALQNLLGKTLAEQLRDTAIRLYFTAWLAAREQGVLIADTAFQFGLYDGQLMLIDECITPDTSRFWALDSYRYGGSTPSMDKQILIDFLDRVNRRNRHLDLPDELLRRIGNKYREAFERLTGRNAKSAALQRQMRDDE